MRWPASDQRHARFPVSICHDELIAATSSPRQLWTYDDATGQEGAENKKEADPSLRSGFRLRAQTPASPAQLRLYLAPAAPSRGAAQDDRDNKLLVAKAFNRIELRGLLRRIITKEDSHRSGKETGNHHNLDGELHFPVKSVF